MFFRSKKIRQELCKPEETRSASFSGYGDSRQGNASITLARCSRKQQKRLAKLPAFLNLLLLATNYLSKDNTP